MERSIPTFCRVCEASRGFIAVFAIVATSCAKGESLEDEPHYGPLDAGPTACTSGTDGCSTDGAPPVYGTGGTIAGSGGSEPSPGAGGLASGGSDHMGGRSGDGGATGGVGLPALGGAPGGATNAGGSADGGSADGGSASGGRGDGGASASGGAAGAGGASGGAGGGSACPNYPTDDACSTCICAYCASQVAACFSSSDTAKNDQCRQVQECAESNQCASTPCYCGAAIACLPPSGPCAAISEQVVGSNNPLEVLDKALDVNHPLGRANQIGICSIEKCKGPCGL